MGDTFGDLTNAPKNGNNVSDQRKVTVDDLAANKVNEERNWKFDDFEIGRPLGRGQFGRVYLVREKKSKYIFAMKVIRKSKLLKCSATHQFRREVDIQRNLKHPNILRLFVWFFDAKCIYLITEYATKGDMYKELRRCKRFTESRASKYIYQVASALEYAHKKHVIHRDIKPENILLDSHDNIKIADFGWSVHSPGSRRNTMCGTLDYLPPEMVRGVEYDERVDNWAIGVLLFEFLTGDAPFYHEERVETYRRIVNGAYKMPTYVSDDAKDVMGKLLQLNPANRMSLAELIAHPWMRKNMPLWEENKAQSSQ